MNESNYTLKPRRAIWPSLVYATVAVIAALFAAEWVPWLPGTLACGALPIGFGLFVAFDRELVAHINVRRRLMAARAAVWIATFAAAVLISMLVYRDPAGAFRETFEMAPPAGVKRLKYERHYAGMFDTDDLLFHFVADEEAIRKMTRGNGWVDVTDQIRPYTPDPGDWDEFCDDALLAPGGRFGKWAPELTREQLRIYHRFHVAGTQPERYPPTAALLWNTISGEAFAHRAEY